MKIRPLSIEGAWEITPQQHHDARGSFLEWIRLDHLQTATGRPVRFGQGNLSTSTRGVLRGVHFADVPPGQAKYVCCVRGRVWDVVVDLRVGSPTFGQCEGIVLDDVDRRAVYLAEGLGHGFCALSDEATVMYLTSTTYRPEREHAVHALDPRLAIPWPVAAPLLSARDQAAPSFDELLTRGELPPYTTRHHFGDQTAGDQPAG
ncbi:dTDP-4-dehydrorhamnose 3,5-epimerase family protein [Micromonospora sp. NPDC047074]|uniref:dTDP-4-dehydrorhamnose 3,5-epimerase family protein n=1 Tax=Micromonospora sp. NPDC047074 TaxID=3154339 RepID=UPI0033E6D5EF